MDQEKATQLQLIPNSTSQPQQSSLDEKRFFNEDALKYTLFGAGLAPGAFFLGAALHEGSHCLTAEILDYDCYDLKLFPYRDQSGHLYFASMKYNVPDDNKYSTNGPAMVIASPMALNAGLISIYSTLAYTDSLPKNKWAKTATLVLGATQVIDLANHVRGDSLHTDSGTLIYLLKEHHGYKNKKAYWTIKGPQIGFTALGVSALAIEGARILTGSNNSQTQRNIRITPTASQENIAIEINGQF